MLQSKRVQNKERVLKATGIALVALGVLVNFSSYLTKDLSLKATVIGVGIGIIGVGVGFLGMWIAQGSENKMRAMANLEFDEKVVAMENYMDEFSEPAFSVDNLQSEYRKFVWDLRATTHVARWADEKRRIEARQRLDRIMGRLTGKIDDTRLDEVKTLCDQIWSNDSGGNFASLKSDRYKNDLNLRSIGESHTMKQKLSVVAIVAILGLILLVYGIANRYSIKPEGWMQFMVTLALVVVTGYYAWSAARQAADTKKLVDETRKSISQAARARRDAMCSEHNWKLFEHELDPGLPGLPDPRANKEYWKWRMVHLSHLSLLHTEWLDWRDGATRVEDLQGWQKWATLLSSELHSDLEEARRDWEKENMSKEPTLADLREFPKTSLRLKAMLDISVRHKWDILPDDFVTWLRTHCGFEFLPGSPAP